MIYSSLLKNDLKAGEKLDKLRVSAGQETDEVPTVRHSSHILCVSPSVGGGFFFTKAPLV